MPGLPVQPVVLRYPNSLVNTNTPPSSDPPSPPSSPAGDIRPDFTRKTILAGSDVTSPACPLPHLRWMTSSFIQDDISSPSRPPPSFHTARAARRASFSTWPSPSIHNAFHITWFFLSWLPRKCLSGLLLSSAFSHCCSDFHANAAALQAIKFRLIKALGVA